jgi:phage host-nuclease inhibitor protein Gam
MEALKNKEEAALAVKRHAHLTAQLGVLIAARNQATAELNKQLADIQAKRQPPIDIIAQQIREINLSIEAWAINNRLEFGGAQSLEFSHGWLRFRQGQRKLECLAKWTWEKVLKKLQDFPVTSQWREYIRNDPEVNKQKLLAETKDGGRLPKARLKEVGLKITVDESFNIEPKPDAVASDCDLMP